MPRSVESVCLATHHSPRTKNTFELVLSFPNSQLAPHPGSAGKFNLPLQYTGDFLDAHPLDLASKTYASQQLELSFDSTANRRRERLSC